MAEEPLVDQIRQRRPGEALDLSFADLTAADLMAYDLSGLNLHGADLRGAHLYRADLRGANLSAANLDGADLLNADLRGANLRDASFVGANLRSANLEGADLEDADLRGARRSTRQAVISDPKPSTTAGRAGTRASVTVHIDLPELASASSLRRVVEGVEALALLGTRIGATMVPHRPIEDTGGGVAVLTAVGSDNVEVRISTLRYGSPFVAVLQEIAPLGAAAAGVAGAGLAAVKGPSALGAFVRWLVTASEDRRQAQATTSLRNSRARAAEALTGHLQEVVANEPSLVWSDDLQNLVNAVAELTDSGAQFQIHEPQEQAGV